MCGSFLALALFLAGGKNLFARPMPDWPPVPMKPVSAASDLAKWHSVKVSPKPLAGIHFYDKLNPVWWLENADDAVPPDWYRPDDPHRLLKWRFRNPFHNFTFYLIGIADKQFTRSGFYPERNASGQGGWDLEIARQRIVLLPFISYERPRVTFYFGWRERGAFGMELKFHKRPAKPDKAQVCSGSSAGGFSPGG
ncbi:MAG TPA: hypothetical protein VGO57_15545 [Verrucomicrobiae bacterium]